MEVKGFLGSSKQYAYLVQVNGENFDFVAEGVTNIEVVVDGNSLDSASSDVSYDTDTMYIRWGAFNVQPGSYKPTIYFYRSGDTQGEVIYSPELNPIDLILYPDARNPKSQEMVFDIDFLTGHQQQYRVEWYE